MVLNRASIADRHAFAFVLIAVLLLLIYLNSFQGTWQLDDQANITDNHGLRIDDLTFESLWGTLFANQGKEKTLWRPLPCLSFALNWYLGKDDPFGYHAVNLAGHVLTAWVLYLLVFQLMSIPMSKAMAEAEEKRISNMGLNPESVALIAAVLWAVNPIQTQAVTYIVQRMAMMAAFFYLLGMYAYVKARISLTLTRRLMFAGLCFLCFLGGIGSKENAILMPASLLLVEWIFFQKGGVSFFLRPKVLLTGSIVFIVSLLSIYVSIGIPFDYISDGYEMRSFTLLERVFTQPRIVLGYLSLIFLPLPERLSIVHDVILSNSLVEPWSTLPSIIIIFGLIIGAIFYARRYPLVCFAVLFYFINHLVESTILPLELFFEHRNYLPSAFLFLPVAAGFCTVLTKLKKSLTGRAVWIGLMIFVIALLGGFSYERNKAWATPESLWRDAAAKAPQNSRPYIFLGVELAWQKNATPADLRHALVLFKHSLNLDMHNTTDRAKTLGNIAWVYFFQGEDEKAVDTFQQAIAEFPDFDKNRRDMIASLMRLGRFDEAEHHAKFLVTKFPGNPEYLNTLGIVLLWQEDYESALACFQTAMRFEPDINENLLFHLGVALTLADHLKRGDWFLRQAMKYPGTRPFKQLSRIENRVRAQDFETAGRISKQMADAMSMSAIIDLFKSLPQYQSVPVAVDIARPVVFSAVAASLKQANVVQE